MDIGKAVIASLEPVSELFVINPKAVQYGGVEVMYVDRIYCHIIAIIISLPIGDARLDAAAGHPDGKAPWMVITAKRIGITLGINSATELTSPDDQRLIQ